MMIEVQSHGFQFEKWVKDSFFGDYAGEYTQKWDVPAERNTSDAVPAGFRGLPVSIKTVRYGSPIALGDAMRQREIDALCGAESEVIHLQDGFPSNTPDEEWAGNLAQSGRRWAVVTSDKFHKHHGERELVKASGLVWFFLLPGWSDQTYWVKSWKLVKAWPAIMQNARRAKINASFSV